MSHDAKSCDECRYANRKSNLTRAERQVMSVFSWLNNHIEEPRRSSMTREDQEYMQGWQNIARLTLWSEYYKFTRAAELEIVRGICASAIPRLPDPFAQGQRDAALSALGLA